MSTPPTAYPGQNPQPHGGRDRFFDSIRSIGIVRTESRWVGGVAGGVARRLNVDPLLIRGAIVVLSVFMGLGLLVYGVAWMLLPEESDSRIHLEQAMRGDVSAGMIGSSAMTLIGVIRPAAWFHGDELWGPFRWFSSALFGLALAALVIGVVFVVVRATGKGREPDAGPAPTAYRAETPSPGGASRTDYGPPRPTPMPTQPPAAYAHRPIPTTEPAMSTPHSHSTLPPTAYSGLATPVAPTPVAPPPPVAPAPPTPPTPPRPPKPVTRGPGAPMIATISGLVLLLVAAALLLGRFTETWRPSLVSITCGGILVLVGLGLVVTGLRGRRSGTLGFYAICGLIILLPLGVVNANSTSVTWSAISSTWSSERTWTPTSVAEANAGLTTDAGEVTVDLRQLEHESADVRVETGFGDVTVIVPKDVPLQIIANSGAGRIKLDVPQDWTVDDSKAIGSSSKSSTNGIGLSTRVTHLPGVDTPLWRITLETGAGQTTITTTD